VFALRVLAFAIEVVREHANHARRGDSYQWAPSPSMAVMCSSPNPGAYGFAAINAWQAFLLESAFILQALADVRYYFGRGPGRPRGFQRGLWCLNALQGACLLLRPALLAVLGAYWLLERWLYRRGHYHKHAED
jgi:hypothetical protein